MLVVDEQNLVVVVCGHCAESVRRGGTVTQRTAAERRRVVTAPMIWHRSCKKIRVNL